MPGAPAPGASAGGDATSGLVNWPRTLAQLRRRPRERAELLFRARHARPGLLYFVVVDGSASTLRGRALAQAKGLCAALLHHACERRRRVGILVFGGERRQCIKPCGRVARSAIGATLARITGGGGTPLRRALLSARHTLHSEAGRHPQERQVLVLITDGRSRDDVSGIGFGPRCERAVIDMEAGAVRLARARVIAARLGAHYRHIETLPAQAR